MAKVIAQITARLPRLMEAGEYRKLRYAGGKPSLQQLKKWIEEGEVIGEVKGGMYFVDLQAAVIGSNDPLLADDGALLEMLTGDIAPKFKTCLERFENEWLTTKTYAASTLKEIKFKLARYREDLGDLMIGQLDVLTVAEYLDGFENNAYTKHRGLLVQVFAFAVAKGLCERNSAELTLVKKEAEKKRQRHTVEGLNKILAYVGTPVWLRRAIRLGLLSLQRREDIVMWPKSAADLEQNTIKVSPGKTQNYGKPVHLEIVMGQALREVVLECVKSPVACPYLIH